MSEKHSITNPQITMINPVLIDPFARQARRSFDEVKLRELASSIHFRGVLQPLLARISPTSEGRYELVAGERRLRAAKLAEIAWVPVILRELSDLDAEEISLTENLQREDLTPVEEADGIWRMLELRRDDGTALYTQESLALKLGKAVNHIKDRVKLRSCPEEMLAAVEKRVVSPAIAAAVGRIPDAKARVLATKQILRPETQEVPLTVQQAREMIKANFMQRITGGLVDPKDARLLPVEIDGDGNRVRGGECGDCPFRSGNNEDLEDQIKCQGSGAGGRRGGGGTGVDAWLCTKPSCLAVKEAAAFSVLADAHLQKCKLNSVMSEATAKKEISQHGEYTTHGSTYTLVNNKPEYREFHSHDMPKWAQLIKGLEVGTVIARHPVNGKVLYLLSAKQKDLAKELIKRGMKASEADAAPSPEVAKQKASRAKELREEKVNKRVAELGVNELIQGISARGLGLEGAKALFEIVVGQAGADGMGFLGKHWKLEKTGKAGSGRDYTDAVMAHVETLATTVNGWLALACFAVLSRSLKWSGAGSGDFTDLLSALQIDKKRLELQAREEIAALELPKGGKGKGSVVKAKKAKGPPDGMGAGETLSGAPVGAVEVPVPVPVPVKTARKSQVISVEQVAMELGLRDEDEAVEAYNAEHELKERIKEYRLEHPGHGYETIAEALMVDLGTVARLDHELSKEGFAPGIAAEQGKKSVEELLAQRALLKKPTKEQGPEAKRAWDAERKRITRALEKLGAVPPAK